MGQETRIFLFSLSALVVLYTMNNVPAFQEPVVILEIGIAVLIAVFLLVYIAVRWNPPKDPLFYVFAEFCFTCIIDLTSALEYDGLVSGFMEFYQKTGEPYLGTPYAIMMCYWDGVAHFIMYLTMVRRMSQRKPYRSLGIFWAGSLVANMTVFVTGIVIGKYGSEIRPAFWLNMPFLLVPVWGAVVLFKRQQELLPVGAFKVERAQKQSLIWRPLDLLLVLCLLAAMGFTLFRGFVTLGCPLEVCATYIDQYEPYLKDPVGYPKVMMLFMMFYATPLLGAFIYGLRTPGCSWMLDWTVFFAGAMSQCQWCHIGASLHPRTEQAYHIPAAAWHAVLLLNMMYVVVPLALSLRCARNPAFFLSPAAPGHSNHEKKVN
ncbi:transmembrane 6 superfamily member 2 [Denticeps clupeoides]|uniref:EXPERA domain-containing protein n=1 Tax=Denticeps clupeoides TaxID=299321 RepID=A0AAY4EE27_9TELE|nr:transmembrane 6 superfamily member 1-like [Denticeps clupeoides]